MGRHEHGAGAFGVETGEAGGDGLAGGPACRAIPMTDAQLDSRDLFAAGRLVTITHGEHTYQLRLTAQNKLILTK